MQHLAAPVKPVELGLCPRPRFGFAGALLPLAASTTSYERDSSGHRATELCFPQLARAKTSSQGPKSCQLSMKADGQGGWAVQRRETGRL